MTNKDCYQKMWFVSDLLKPETVSQEICDIFFVKKVEKSVNGQVTYRLEINDKTGVMKGVVWEPNINESYLNIKNAYVKVTGKVGVYNGRNNLNITLLEPVKPTEINVEDYCPNIANASELYNRFLSDYRNDIKNDWGVELLDRVFVKNEALTKKLEALQGGTFMHHAYWGGWIVHTYSVYQLSKYISHYYQNILPVLLPQNPELWMHQNFNTDVLLIAAALHDIGKVKEYMLFPENQRTDIGKMVGHVTIGYHCIETILSQMKKEGINIPYFEKLKLLHCILASHSSSNKERKLLGDNTDIPFCLEAIILSHVDEIDARIDMFNQFIIKDNEPSLMTKFIPQIGHSIYKG
jgi:3'-5' exoribonuclease